MGFSESVSKGFNNITNFEGRAGRAEFWWLALAVIVGLAVIEFVVRLIFHGWFGLLIMSVIWVVGALAIIAAGVRRLHDVGQSGWIAVLWFVPCLLWIVPLIFSVQAGNPGPNPYGPPPTA